MALLLLVSSLSSPPLVCYRNPCLPLLRQSKPAMSMMLIANPISFPKQLRSSLLSRTRNRVKAFFFNPTDEPILKEALKEPVAFMGGVFAGLLRLDLNDDPLKEWVSRTVEASGITEEEIEAEGLKPEEEEAAQQIEIE
ncbi:hypothetical protein PanWU01x14_171050 [Parasponia andersonii]|uniref:Uncharacterized protein n=1 Tax=Parasponia andersonii TaxID=3476 RepID=A0A2P5C9P2_PARAD|nr:hypothetical protein PanWU01x14_171050 [Parasponia andersonii]